MFPAEISSLLIHQKMLAVYFKPCTEPGLDAGILKYIPNNWVPRTVVILCNGELNIDAVISVVMGCGHISGEKEEIKAGD